MRKIKVYWKINLVLAGFLTSLVTDGIFYSFGVFLPVLVNDFNTSKGETSWIGSLSRGFVQLIGLVVGPLTKNFGCMAVAIVGSFLAAIALFLSSLAVSILYLDFSYGLLGGCAAGFCIHPAVIATTINFSAHRGLAVGLVTAGTGCGTLVVPLIMSTLLHKYKLTWRTCFAISSGCVLIVIVFALFLRPFNPCPCCCKLVRSHDVTEGSAESEEMSSSIPSKPEKKKPCLFCLEIMYFFCNYALLTKPRFLFMCVGGALVSLGMFVPTVFIVDFAQTSGFTSEESSVLLPLMGVTNMLSRIGLGYLTDQSWTNVLGVFILGTLLGGAVTVPLGYMRHHGLLIGYCCLYGISLGCVLSLRSNAVYELIGKDDFHEAFGMYLLFTGVCALFGPPLFGKDLKIYGPTNVTKTKSLIEVQTERLHDYEIAFLSSGLVILTGTLFLVLIPTGDLIRNQIQKLRHHPRPVKSSLTISTRGSSINS